MLKIILFTSLFSFSALAQLPGDDMTCALKSSSTNLQKGSVVLTLDFLGNNVYEMRRFTAYTRAQNYRSVSRSSDGVILRLKRLDQDTFKLGNRIRLDDINLELTENTTGGSYPGAGSAPSRFNKFKCILNYGPTQTVGVTKDTIKADFNL